LKDLAEKVAKQKIKEKKEKVYFYANEWTVIN